MGLVKPIEQRKLYELTKNKGSKWYYTRGLGMKKGNSMILLRFPTLASIENRSLFCSTRKIKW